jgi:quercetin dioxygenase-like cupin family protein
MLAKEKEALLVQAGAGKKMQVIGNEVTVKLAAAETGGEYYVFEVITPAGLGVPPHVHQHEDEIIEVVDGEFEFMLGGQIYQGTAGSLVHFPRGLPHAFTNVGSTPGKTMWTVIPGRNFEQFFDELGALPAGPPDLAKVAAIFSKYDIEILPPPGNGGVGGL